MGAALLLSSCWLPENFEANITVNKDGSYTFSYDGTLAFGIALAKVKEGPLSKKDEADFEKLGEDLRKEPGFKRVEYLREGRFKVFVKRLGEAGERYYFLSRNMKILDINPQQNGSIQITVVRFSEKDLNKLKSIGARVNGTLTVSVKKGVKVIKHNAQSEPKLFGLFGGYEWELTSVDAQPFIVVQPSS